MTYYIATAKCSMPAIKQLALTVLKMLGSKLALSWCYKTGLYIQMVSRVIIIRGFYLDLLLTFPLLFIKTLVNVNQSDKSIPDN